MRSPLHRFRFVTLVLLSLSFSLIAVSTDYAEHLHLETLPSNHVLASFTFITNGTFASHHAAFPRSLAQILSHTRTHELHLRFTLGRWDSLRWGAPIRDGITAGGTGVELWAWVEEPASQSWKSLTNALSGFFCASLNFIDETRTIAPVMTFKPADGRHGGTRDRLRLLHGSLPREPVCTENLTPFLKLLPCKGKAGISSLLDGHKLFDAEWQSMAIDVKPVCDTDDNCSLQVQQTVDMVFDVERSLLRRDAPVPKPKPLEHLSCDPEKAYSTESNEECFPRAHLTDLPWSLNDIFGRPVRGSCPLAGLGEHICANVPSERPIYISAGAKEQKYHDGKRCFVVNEEDFDMILPEHLAAISEAPELPPLLASRSFTGHGQQNGGIQAVLRNPTSSVVEFIYLEALPWFMKPYLHTLRVRIEGEDDIRRDLIDDLYYRPGLDRHRGTHLEASMHLPANSTLILSYDFEKAILRYTEYPPDANRGFDIAPAIITVKEPAFAIRTTSLLLSLPTPDFSMPYNVIILTSTVMALAFGSIFNLVVRRLVAADEVGESRVQKAGRAFRSILTGIKENIAARRNKRVTAVDGEESATQQESE